MQSLSVKKGSLQSTVKVPSSKSYANRALILSAISNQTITLTNMPKASDVTNLLRCLRGIGLDIVIDADRVITRNSFPACETHGKELDVGEGGTTARFLAGLLLLGKQTYILKLGTRLKDRPWNEFIELATSLGAEVSLSDDKLSLKGPIKFPELIEVDCSKTTQFATAFQLIAPSGTKIKPLNLNSSLSYWKMNEKVIADVKSGNYQVPSDWSSASYPLAFAALNHKISFPALHADEFQADSKFIDILKKYKAVVETTEGLEVSPCETTGNLNFDVSDALDLVPTLAYFLSHIKGQHVLTGIANLVHKESDRLNEVMKLMKIFGRHSETKNNTLIIEGHHQIIEDQQNLVFPDDHRMVMVGTLFLLHHNGGSVYPAEAVNKSYPEFFELLSSQGKMNKSGK
jgi:3-phosphoshikimate 1-carboxyvinyltransferase